MQTDIKRIVVDYDYNSVIACEHLQWMISFKKYVVHECNNFGTKILSTSPVSLAVANILVN